MSFAVPCLSCVPPPNWPCATAQIDASSRRAFEEIVAECGKASRLLSDMLTLARADAGNSQLAFEPVDLAEVVKTVCQKGKPLADERGHTLVASTECPSCSATVWGDYSQSPTPGLDSSG